MTKQEINVDLDEETEEGIYINKVLRNEMLETGSIKLLRSKYPTFCLFSALGFLLGLCSGILVEAIAWSIFGFIVGLLVLKMGFRLEKYLISHLLTFMVVSTILGLIYAVALGVKIWLGILMIYQFSSVILVFLVLYGVNIEFGYQVDGFSKEFENNLKFYKSLDKTYDSSYMFHIYIIIPVGIGAGIGVIIGVFTASLWKSSATGVIIGTFLYYFLIPLFFTDTEANDARKFLAIIFFISWCGMIVWFFISGLFNFSYWISETYPFFGLRIGFYAGLLIYFPRVFKNSIDFSQRVKKGLLLEKFKEEDIVKQCVEVLGGIQIFKPDWEVLEILQKKLNVRFYHNEDLRKINAYFFYKGSLGSLVPANYEKADYGSICVSKRSKRVIGLRLQKCEISVLPKAITRLEYLMGLDLESNKLNEIPNFLAEFENLRYLNIADNRLTTLPSNFGKLRLIFLDLTYNCLASIPKCLFKVTTLKILRIGHNYITSIPEAIEKLKSLESLDLSNIAIPGYIGNQINTLPRSIGDLQSLRMLMLDRIGIESLPESIGKLSSLTTLSLNFNPLSMLPKSIKNLTKLEYIKLGGRPKELKEKSNEYLQKALLEKDPRKARVLGLIGEELKADLISRNVFQEVTSSSTPYQLKSTKTKIKKKLRNPKSFIYSFFVALVGVLGFFWLEMLSLETFLSNPFFLLVFTGVLISYFLIGVAIMSTLSGYVFQVANFFHDVDRRFYSERFKKIANFIYKNADLLFVYYLLYTLRSIILTIGSLDMIPSIGILYEDIFPNWLVLVFAIFDYNLVLGDFALDVLFVFFLVGTFFMKGLWFWSLYTSGANPLNSIKNQRKSKYPVFLIIGIIAPILITLVDLSSFNVYARLGYSVGAILGILIFLFIKFARSPKSLISYLLPVLVGILVSWIFWLFNPILSIFVIIGFIFLFLLIRRQIFLLY
ncbi:MAG: membrane protein of unknown function [Promethearchaeota archaeon]|nr:MAG: membrane protein of unknown function [Candidatus Lokiarchaeota archaeon]